MSSPLFFYFGPDVLDTPGFVYGTSETRDGNEMDVRRLASGRWSDMSEFGVSLPTQQVLRREVTEQEARVGLGTYVGSCVCVPRRRDGGPERWAYGVVTGFRWSVVPERRVLHVTAADGSFDVTYEEELLQDLAIETYALRLCDGKPILTLMDSEMRAINRAAYDLFNARGRAGVRCVGNICRRIDIEPVDEGGRVSLFEMISMEVVQVHAKYVLDYVFYHDRGRRLPTTIIIGASVFDEPGGRTVQPAVSNSAHNAAETRVSNELVDSDEDSDDSLLIPRRASATTTMRGARKRDRDPDTDEQSGNPPARLCNDAGSRAGLPAAALIETVLAAIEGRGQFRPTRMQTTVHLSIVNGTYSLMGAQFFLERLQSQIGLLAFLPHPAVLKEFYAWEFGTRGLSVMHFGRLDMSSRRRAFGELDMCDFSSRNSLPRPIHARSLDDLISAIDCLALLVGDVYQSFVGNVVAAARQFFLCQKAFDSTFDEDAVVKWDPEFSRQKTERDRWRETRCDAIKA